MRKFFLISITLLFTFPTFAQSASRETVAVVIGTVLYGDSYDFNNNPANNYPSPFIDIDVNSTNGQILNIISRLDYGDGITPFPFINDGSSSFHPSGFMSRAGAILAIVEAWNIPITADFTSPFADIPNGYALLPWINAAYNNNIIFGTNFFPANAIQTEDIVNWAIAAENSPFGNISTNILDSEENYFLPHLYLPENLGMFKGLEQGVFSHYAKNSFVIPDVQMNLNFSHFYSTSMVELPESFFLNQPLGRGWSHTYNIFAQRQLVFLNGDSFDTEFFYITWADGTVHVYNTDDEEWITEGVYNEARNFSSGGNHFFEVTTKDHTVYLFENLNDSYENYYLIEIIDKNGNTIEIEYENAQEKPWLRRIEKVIAPSGKELEFTYEDNSDLIDEIEDPIGREIDFGYSNGRLRRFDDAKNNETEYFYVTNDDDNNFERFLLKEVELPRGNSIEATYDSDKDGYLSSYKVNNNDPVLYDIDVDYSQSIPITVNMDVPMPNGGTDEHTSEYNSLGLLETFQSGTDDIVIDYPSPNSSNPFLPSEVSNHNIDIEYEYDSNGNVEYIDYENGARDYQFDWNSDNELQYSIDPNGNRTDYDYDNDHNLIRITDPNNNDIDLEYFSNGNLMSITNQEGITIDFNYYNDGALQTFSAPENIGGSFTYDGINRMLSKTVNGLTSSYTYDENDNIETFINSGQHTTVFSYDDNDNIATITNANNVQTVFDYNIKDQVTSETFGSLETEYDYNDDDTLDEIQKPSGQTIEMDYTSDGQYRGSGTVIDVDYDSNERVESIESIDAKYLFDYDSLNQIELVEIEGQNRDVGYEYNPAGNITKIFYPNAGSGAYIRYQYDDKNRLSAIRTVDFNNFPNTVIADYEYLDDDRISHIEYGNGFITTYVYDDAGRPTGMNHVHSNGDVYYDEIRTLNNRSNVTAHQIGYFSEFEPVYTPPTEEQNFQYDNNNHIITDEFNIDVDGNTVTAPAGVFTYDIDDQARERIVNGNTSQYEYDPFGNRIKKNESNGADTEYLWDVIGKNIIQEYNVGGGEPRSFIYGLGLEARIVNGVILYYQGDLRGNVVLTTNQDGERSQDYQYGPFGHTVGVNAGPNPDDNHYTFLGKQGIIEDDRDAGLYYVRARYYDATIGRFITEDPIRNNNLYTYSNNSPISNVDFNGENWESTVDNYIIPTLEVIVSAYHISADVAGLVPAIGEFADGYNALLYSIEGDYLNAGLSGAAAIPFLGWGATAGKYANRVDNLLSSITNFERLKGGVKQGFSNGNVNDVYNSLIEGATHIRDNLYQLNDGTFINKHKNTIDINTNGNTYKIRFDE